MKKEIILTFIFFLVVVVVFFSPILKGYIPFPGDLLVGNYAPYNTESYFGIHPGGVAHKGQGVDVIRQLYPWKKFAIDSFKMGQIPFWNPYNLSGSPLMANFQSGVFYPFNVLFFILPFINAWTIYIFLIPLLSSFFLYLFLRLLKVEKVPSILGGITFGFSSYMVVWLEWGNVGHVFLWLPILLYFLERIINKIKVFDVLFFILISAIAFLGGYIQGYFYMVLCLVLYYFLKIPRRNRFTVKSVGILAALFVFPLLLTLFQLLPTLELFGNSARNNYSLSQIEKLLNPFWYLITIVVPNFFGNPAARNYWFDGTYIERAAYIGLIPLVFSIFALTQYKKKREIVIFGIIFISSLIISTDLFVTKFLYLLPIPLLSTTVPTRVLSLFVFSGSILSAFGLDMYIKNENKITFIKVLIGISFVIVLSWIFAFVVPFIYKNQQLLVNLSTTKRNLIPSTMLLSAFILVIFMSSQKFFPKKYIKGFLAVFIIGLTAIDLLLFFQKITPFSPKEYIFPKTKLIRFLEDKKDRAWGYGTAYIDTNFFTYEKAFSTDGYEPLLIKRYGELLSSSKNGTVLSEIPRSDANIVTGFGNEELKTNAYRKKILDLLNVKYILNKTENSLVADTLTFPQDQYTLIWNSTPWQVYENKSALPRFYLVGNAIVESNTKNIIAKLYDKSIDLSKTAIIESPIEKKFNVDQNAKVSILQYSANQSRVQTESKSAMLLVMTDAYYPGWKASVDGKDATIYRANYALRAIPIDSGKHIVRIWYQPESFKIGMLISGISLVGLFLFLIVLRKHHE